MSKSTLIKNQKTILGLLCLMCLLCAGAMAQRSATYSNPVLAGDYPDPSVIRVGNDYYATATSSEWGPEFPILHSRDLVNWNIIGSVFPKRPEWSVGNYWAPEIWQEKGKFFMYYVARKAGGSLCVAVAKADKPTGPYKDYGALVCQEVGSIDGFPIRDENGKLFLVWKEDGNSVGKPTPIWAQQLTEDGTKLVGTATEILRNDPATWEGNLVEGAYIERRNAYFYMFYSGSACCTRDCKYAMGVARSKTLLGKWEKYDKNPIVAGNDEWKCPGHGTIVKTPAGRDYMLYHAYDAKDTVYVGRQAVLDEVTWTADGWATINDGKGVSRQAAAPLKISERNLEYSFFDDYLRPNLQDGWQWQQYAIPTFNVARGFLTLTAKPEQAANEIGGVMARSSTTGDYTATTEIDLQSLTNNAIAGIAAYGDDENAVGAGFHNNKIVVWRREKKQHQVVTTIDAPKAANLFLRMTARDGHLYKFAVSTDNRNFAEVGAEQNGFHLPPWDRGVRIAQTVGGAPSATARFGFLRVEPVK